MIFSEFLKSHVVRLDGGMGTLLQEKGLRPGEAPERWNLTHPEILEEIHGSYLKAGSHVISTNTFGANLLHFSKKELEEVISAAVRLARSAIARYTDGENRFVALDIGPSGRLLKPLGDLPFEEAVTLFRATVEIGVRCGVDLILLETFNDSLETKAALLAVKESTSLPVLVSNAYGEDGTLLTGATPAAMIALLEGMGADAVGANCSLGPKKLFPVARELLRHASLPVLLKPNAGLPREENKKTVFDVSPEQFAEEMLEIMQEGLRLVGGCCGTTPEHISALTQISRDLPCPEILPKHETVVSSYGKAVFFSERPLLIGERINPTGKKRLKAALQEGDMAYLQGEAIRQEERGAHILDVNVGLPGLREDLVLEEAVMRLQAVTALPLQIDTGDPVAMERALRAYNGKAMINSVNGKAESMEAMFPLAKKYGGVLVALTLDESGIPSSAEGRIEIAKKILKKAEEYGISKKDLVFDPLAMAVSADPSAAKETLRAVRMLREMGCLASLGVSNVSFGLPAREAIGSTFFALALQNGLSAAIMNPDSAEMQKAYRSFLALNGMDESFAGYISFAETLTPVTVSEKAVAREETGGSPLQFAILKGMSDRAGEVTRELLSHTEAMTLVNEEIIPALDAVGRAFEEKRVYLPGLLMSAEAAKAAFEIIRTHLSRTEESSSKPAVVLATVKGDIHDIGKNILRLLMENYGFRVIDLGKDVPPEKIVAEAVERNAPLVGLSALMTTTVSAMEETIALLRKNAPSCKIMVGGAVLTEDYAQKIGADFYAKDAMEGVRFAEGLLNG